MLTGTALEPGGKHLTSKPTASHVGAKAVCLLPLPRSTVWLAVSCENLRHSHKPRADRACTRDARPNTTAYASGKQPPADDPWLVALGAWEDGANASGGADGGSVNAVLISFHILIQKLLTIELRLYKIRD